MQEVTLLINVHERFKAGGDSIDQCASEVKAGGDLLINVHQRVKAGGNCTDQCASED